MGKPRNRHENFRKTATERERTIMGHWDAGKGSKWIARELGITEGHVMNIISMLCVNHQDRWEPDARTATLQLACRIRQVHPQMAGAA
jgi:DNA-binding NarL/FixJ family response regulator